MAEYLDKLRPDRDLQCYFQRPSAIAALSECSANGFTVSGSWREQFDWAVVEWNRDNGFEHPALRNLPDGDLSGLQLSYEERRNNSIALDSTWFPTVPWPYLRIWAEDNGAERLYMVPLNLHATAVEDSGTGASATFELNGPVTAGDYVELAWQDQHFTYLMYGGDTPESAVLGIANAINGANGPMAAVADGNRITLTYATAAGANGNRVGVYGNVSGARTESWTPWWQVLHGGMSPSTWRIDLDFANLTGYIDPVRTQLVPVPTRNVRKMRWTWSADLQPGNFTRTDFSVVVTNWTVTGSNRRYFVAGPGSRRVEDNARELAYSGTWSEEARGNFSGGSIRHTEESGASVQCTYEMAAGHTLYLGTRRAPACGAVSVQIDQNPPIPVELELDEDVLVRVPLSELAGNTAHTVTVMHAGPSGSSFYFDFLEMAVRSEGLPVFPFDPRTTLATDWDTDHSLALAPERTAWLIRSLGFTGRANHYVGAMWWYELYQPGQQYAHATVTFSGTSEFSGTTELRLGPTVLSHLNLIGDTAASIAKAFELKINEGSTGVWAHSEAGELTITARAMGTAGNGLEISATTNSQDFTAAVSGALSGGRDGTCRSELEPLPEAAWCTDTEADPPLNRAAQDWHRSYFKALKGYGIEVAAALSMELRHGDPAAAAGLAQRYPNGQPVWLNTPALQTNFSPVTTAFWKRAFLALANVQAEAGLSPYLQFGEVQWWYFPAPSSGMPFYDDYTQSAFQTTYGRPMHVFLDAQEAPASFPNECAFLPGLIGAFTDAVIDYIRPTYPQARFEVLYAPDVNDATLTRVINLPAAYWSPGKLTCFKTENFTYTGSRDLNRARLSIQLPAQLGFARNQSSHLVGVGEYTTPWLRECEIAKGEGVESVVLFALDQYCFIGYVPLAEPRGARSLFMG